MKNLILILATIIFSAVGFAQLPDKSLSAYELKGSVKEVNTNIYYYRASQEAYILSSTDKKKFSNDGLLSYNYSELSMLSSDYEYKYEYEADKLKKFFSKTIDKKTKENKSERITNYIYKSDRLSEIQFRGVNPTTIKFEYNDKNQVVKETKVGLGGEMMYEKIYEQKGENQYSTKTYFYTKGVKSEKANEYSYENGKLVSSVYRSYGEPAKSSYSYNDNGDKTAYYYKGKLKNEFIYVYDKHQNWIVKTKKAFNTYSKDYTYTYTFRKIKYKKGSTGSVEMDEKVVRKYEKRDSYEVKAYKSAVSAYSKILINPEKVNEMLVLKTSGSKFKVKTDSGNYLTNHVSAIKHTNGLDMIVYHPKSKTTGLVKDFNDDLFKRDFWHKAEIISSTDTIFWTVNEKGNWYIINAGKAYDKYEVTKLKYSTDNPDDVIVYVNEVAIYKMKNYRNATHHKLYPLRRL